MRFALVVAMVALFAIPAAAQHMGGGKHHRGQQHGTAKKANSREAERDYKAALQRIPDKKPGDPWAHIR